MKKTIALLAFIQIFIGTIFLTGCQQRQRLPTGEGYISVDGGKVWYRELNLK